MTIINKIKKWSRGGERMERILYIKANPKKVEDSYTLKIAETFVKEYKERNKNSEIIELDLYKEDLSHVDMERLGMIFSEEENNLSRYADEFAGFDKYIIAAPMWNLSIPSILKTYIDHITVAGKTFRYTENGPQGLLENKKLIHITSRGGMYSSGPGADFEMGDRYLRTIFGFIGIEDFHTIAFESTAALSPQEVEQNLQGVVKNIYKHVEKF